MEQEGHILEARTFKALRINLASPEVIESWSYGEVTKPETINYRRLRPEKDGLFCEAIFGPTHDYQCYCGKYKGIRYRGIICDKCGVEVTRSAVRRKRMGHITLAAPVAHVWYTRRVPSHLSILLDVRKRSLDRVLYFAQYIITNIDEGARERALIRLEEQERGRTELLEQAAQQRIAEIEAQLAAVQKGRQTVQEKVHLDFRNELDTRTDQIAGAAQRLQDRMEGMMGRVVSEPIIFTPTDNVIVESGEQVLQEHYTTLSTVAQNALEMLEREMQEREQEKLASQDTRIGNNNLRVLVEAQTGRIREELQGKLQSIENRYEAEREELLGLQTMQLFNEVRYRELRQKWGQVFSAGMGAEAIYRILRHLDLAELADSLWNEVRYGTSKTRRKRATRRLRVVEALRRSGNSPEWLILTILPVLPPELRPMVQLEGGRFAASDLNDLYRRVINRNNRLKRLLDLGAPEVIIHNEKRMLQEAVDSLIDNSQRGKAMSRRGRRPLKSLSDMLKGKKGRFRRNLLGKRVDYSGRSVIVVGAKLKMHQCGLPKTMALELYRPFVIQRLVEYNYAANVKAAKRLIEQHRPEVWEVVEEVIEDRPVLLNRAPTLHRLGIQAFEPVLVEGKAIHLHPLVCAAFNADFDGDQMAVHLPLSRKAVEEARALMLASKNVLKPADGHPVIGPSKDMCLGIYYMTMEGRPNAERPLRAFIDMDEVQVAYALEQVQIHDPILLSKTTDVTSSEWGLEEDAEAPSIESTAPGELMRTTVGRALFNRIVPNKLRFINRALDKGDLNDLIALCYRQLGRETTVEFAEQIELIGFEYATLSGITISIYDLTVPKKRQRIIDAATQKVTEIERQYRRGLLTEEEQYNRVIEIWSGVREAVSQAVAEGLDPFGSIAVMAKSGASKGGYGPISQIAGMRGLMADPSGRIIPLPILSNLREGLTGLEYFISTHGSRKGLADTALRTADAGYLTRRLVDTAQDIIINAVDCGTRKGFWISREDEIAGEELEERILARIAAAPVVHPETGEILVERNMEIDEDKLVLIKEAGVNAIYVRSPLTCELEHGICALCYGRDLGRGKPVEVGLPVGVIAAQSIGEPGTQLTLRTFHTGGTASSVGDITSGLPRVEELLEARKSPKGESEITDIGGIVYITREGDMTLVRIVDTQTQETTHIIPPGWEIYAEDGDRVKEYAILARNDETNEEIRAPDKGYVRREGREITCRYDVTEEREYEVLPSARLLVSEGEQVSAGIQLYEGVPNPHRVLEVQGREAVQRHLLNEIQQVYRSQGVNINDKHFEVIIRKMLSMVLITETGDTEFLPGDLVDRLVVEKANRGIVQQGGKPARARQVLLGLTKVSLNTDSFLSAASFQHTIKILSNAAVEGCEDPLYGLKENVIIGKLIPAGTGYRGDIECADGPLEEFEGVHIEKELPKGTLWEDEEREERVESEEHEEREFVSIADLP
ncbi:MAG TPA: DNA-directed RNA polymerase subunit beta' [Thermoflexia bacterium]|nr:DNA-directed RNA polymerase subunit beta' [Thermoflexia bacterium]